MAAGYFETEDEAWSCFTRRLRSWFDPTKQGLTLTDCIEKALKSAQQITVNETVYITHFPVYLGLLVVSILPLTDDATSFINASDYYKRAAVFMKQNALPSVVPQTQTDNWNKAWQKLEHWAIEKKHCAWGRFHLNESFGGHKYVGKPFSQCLIPPRVIRDLPKAFVRAGWVPYQLLTQLDWQSLLTTHCYDLGFRQAALKTLLTPDGQHYATPILQERFAQWDGTAQTAASPTIPIAASSKGSLNHERINKEDTYARFYITSGLSYKNAEK